MGLHKFFSPITQCVQYHRLWGLIVLLLCASEAAGQTGLPSSLQTAGQTGVFSSLPSTTLTPAPSFPDLTGRRLVLIPYLTVSERYDDNIFQDRSSEAEDDFVTTVAPGVRLYYHPQPEAVMSLDYRVNWDLFADHADRNHAAHQANLQYTGQLTRLLSLNVRDRFSLTEDPGERQRDIDEANGGNPGSEQRRERVLRNSANVVLGIQVSPRIDMSPFFGNILHDVEDPNEVDELQYTVGAEIGYLTDTLRQNRVFIGYRADFFNFSDNGNPVLERVADFKVHTANVGYRHAFSATLTGDMAIGYAVAISDRNALGDESAVIGTVGLIKTLRTGNLSLRYRRQFASGGSDGGRAVADIFTSSISTNITPKIIVALSSNLSLIDVKDEIRVDAGDNTRADRIFWTIRPGLTYQVLRSWSFSVAYDYSVTNSDDNTEDRHDHQVTVATQLVIRERLFLSLAYRYTARRFDEQDQTRDEQSFDRNQVVLSITYGPPLLLR